MTKHTSKQISKRFASKCGTCKQDITSSNGGETWKHGTQPTDKHRAYASGVMTQI